jgi:hypothetical protein
VNSIASVHDRAARLASSTHVLPRRVSDTAGRLGYAVRTRARPPSRTGSPGAPVEGGSPRTWLAENGLLAAPAVCAVLLGVAAALPPALVAAASVVFVAGCWFWRTRLVLQALAVKGLAWLVRTRWHYFGAFVVGMLVVELCLLRGSVTYGALSNAGETLIVLLAGAAIAALPALAGALCVRRLNRAVIALDWPWARGAAVTLSQATVAWSAFDGLSYAEQPAELADRLREAFIDAIERAAARWPGRRLRIRTHHWVIRHVLESPRVRLLYALSDPFASTAVGAPYTLAYETLMLADWRSILRGDAELWRRTQRRVRRCTVVLVPAGGAA